MLHDRVNICDLLSRKNSTWTVPNELYVRTAIWRTKCGCFLDAGSAKAFGRILGLNGTDENIHNMIIDAKHRYNIEFIMEIIIIGCWSIWNQRNGMIFDGIQCSINACKMDFKNNFHMSLLRAKPSIKEGMRSWIDNV